MTVAALLGSTTVCCENINMSTHYFETYADAAKHGIASNVSRSKRGSPSAKMNKNYSHIEPRKMDIHGKNYKMFNVPGDGNCFFHCISLSIHGEISHTLEYRLLICGYILNHWIELEDKVKIYHMSTITPQIYRNKMLLINGWATTAEIETAANILGRNITVWTDNNMYEWYSTKYTPSFPCDPESDVEVLLTNCHFQLLQCNLNQNSIDDLPPKRKLPMKDGSPSSHKRTCKPSITTQCAVNEAEMLPADRSFDSMSISPTQKVARKLGVLYESKDTNESLQLVKNKRRRNKDRI